MLKNNFQYKDNYMFFKFNGIHSSQYNVMIQNDINDLKIVVNENASIDYVSPKYQNGRYVMGVTRSHRPLPHKLVAYGLTRAEANQIAAWLSPGTIGALIYDYALDWQYNVIISKLGDMNLYPIDAKHFVISFDIEFNTIEGTDAQSTQDAIIMLDIEDVYSSTSDIETEAHYYGINNHKLIPSIACYKKFSSPASSLKEYMTISQPEVNDQNYQCIIPLYVHHIGSGYTKLNISANVGQGAAQCSIIDDRMLYEASISYEVSEFSALLQNKILEYKSNNHLFFINNEMPETKEAHLEIKGLQTKYSTNSISIHSPGNIILCGSAQDLTLTNIAELISTPYSWFFYCTNDSNDLNTEFYKLYGNSDKDEDGKIDSTIFPLDGTGTFYYDVDYIQETQYQFEEGELGLNEGLSNYTVDTTSLLTQIQNGKYRYVYFGFYNIVTVSCDPLKHISVTATQFNNLLLEET